ncbi:hypothetical protein GCM10020331_029840 [Ectobacillus funiculus]
MHHNNDKDGMRDATSELSLYDNHPGDTATDLFEREKKILASLNFVKKQLADVRYALEKNRKWHIWYLRGIWRRDSF